MEVSKTLDVVKDEPGQRDHHKDDERDGDEHHRRPVPKNKFGYTRQRETNGTLDKKRQKIKERKKTKKCLTERRPIDGHPHGHGGERDNIDRPATDDETLFLCRMIHEDKGGPKRLPLAAQLCMKLVQTNDGRMQTRPHFYTKLIRARFS